MRAIVSYEPGSGFVFPEGEVPDSLPTINPLGALTANVVSLAEFERLTRIPIVIYYGDNIPAEPSDVWGQDGWRVRMQMARLFAECINRHGGGCFCRLFTRCRIAWKYPFPDVGFEQYTSRRFVVGMV